MLGSIIKGIWRCRAWILEVTSILAEYVGGWTVLFGIAFGLPSMIWALLLDWGPFSPIVGLFAAGLGMMVFDYGIHLKDYRRRKADEVLETVLDLYSKIVFGKGCIERLLKNDEDALEEVVNWDMSVRELLVKLPYDEFIGFETMPPAGKLDKLRLIAMRYVKDNGIHTSDIEDYKRRIAERYRRSLRISRK